MSAIVIIPARYASTRFPGKPLALLKGMPVIRHVYENAKGSRLAKEVLVATDNEEIFRAVSDFGGKAVMTSDQHPSGTDRIAEAAAALSYDIIVNVQGDEPLIKPEMIDDVISLLDDPGASIGTLAVQIKDRREVFDPNTVKAVFSTSGHAFYFSRAPIPYHRDIFSLRGDEFDMPEVVMYKHIGIYSYRKDILLALASLKPTRLEMIEKLEQLRALEHGFVIKVKETIFETSGVDTPEDLERIEQCLNSSL